MRGLLFAILAMLLLVGGVWFLLRDDGVIDEVNEDNIRAVLLENRVPKPMANCMAPRLVDQLSLNQLRKLQRAAPQDGEGAVPLSTGEAIARLRRVDDRETVETVVSVAGGCGFELMIRAI